MLTIHHNSSKFFIGILEISFSNSQYLGLNSIFIREPRAHTALNPSWALIPTCVYFSLESEGFLLDENDRKKIKIRTLFLCLCDRSPLFASCDSQNKAPQRCPHHNPWIMQDILCYVWIRYIMWQGGIEVAHRIKLAKQQILKRDYPALSRGAQCPLNVEESGKRFKDATLLALKMEEGTMSQGIQVARRNWKR